MRRIVSLEISEQECRRLAAEARERALLNNDDPGERGYWMRLSDKWSREADLACTKTNAKRAQ